MHTPSSLQGAVTLDRSKLALCRKRTEASQVERPLARRISSFPLHEKIIDSVVKLIKHRFEIRHDLLALLFQLKA